MLVLNVSPNKMKNGECAFVWMCDGCFVLLCMDEDMSLILSEC